MERSGLSAIDNNPPGFADNFARNEAHASGVSWAAVIAGAFVAAALWLILLALGTGMGLSSVSLWSNAGASASTIGKASIVWLIIIRLIASAMGGYLAGRLRTKWATIHSDEVYFRDTAHGFLVWAVGLVVTAGFLASGATSMIGGAGSLGSTSYSPSGAPDPNGYFIDKLFRSNHPGTNAPNAPARAEATRIFVHALGQGNLPAADQAFLADRVVGTSGLNHADAERRVAA